MMSQDKLTVALVIALSSNATLLALLLLQSLGLGVIPYGNSQDALPAVSCPQISQFRGYQVDKHVSHAGAGADVETIPHSATVDIFSGASAENSKGDQNFMHYLLKMKQTNVHHSGIDILLKNYQDMLNNVGTFGDLSKRYRSASQFFEQQKPVQRHATPSTVIDLLMRSSLRHANSRTLSPRSSFTQDFSEPIRNTVTKASAFSKTSQHLDAPDSNHEMGVEANSFLDQNQSSETSVNRSPLHSVNISNRARRHAYLDPSGQAVAEEPPKNEIEAILSSLTKEELAQFPSAVAEVLLPALFHFEGLVIRELEKLNKLMVNQDLRLEELEREVLNIGKRSYLEPQADAVDNKSELDNLKHVLREDGFALSGNISETYQLDIDGSGEGELGIATTPTTTPPPTTSTQTFAYYDLFRTLSAVEQKVMALENYNVMSDSELTRVRSEVVKMDDKVTELERRYRNMQIRTSMHTYKITELEMMMSKSDMGLHSTLDAYARVNSRVEAFKDRLSDFKNDLHAVAVQFGRHDQIANELRAADSYKAHDIQELRKTVYGLESRLNGLYRVLDQNADSVRNDLRSLLDRLCFNNHLSC